MFWLEIVINVLDDVVVFFLLLIFISSLVLLLYEWVEACILPIHKAIVHVNMDVSAVMRPQTYQKLFYPHPHSVNCMCFSHCVCMGICVEERDHTVLIYNDNFTNNGHYNKLCLDEQWKSWKIITFNFSHENFSIWLWSN